MPMWKFLKLEGTYENFKLKDILNPSPLARKKRLKILIGLKEKDII